MDEIHQEMLTRREPLGVKIARREILSLFEAYCTLLRAASLVKDDPEWLAQVEKHGGIIVSVDGLQPEKGHETVSLVRDALTGRVLGAENVLSSETAVMKELRKPVVAWGVRVLGTITDAHESERLAVEQLWPNAPPQVCPFHALRDASQPAFEADRNVKTARRKTLQSQVRAVRKQRKRDIPKGSSAEAEQLSGLDDYARGLLAGLNRDGLAPFDFAAVPVGEDLDERATSLERLEKKGAAVSTLCAQKRARLRVIVAERSSWVEQREQGKRRHQGVREAEHLLDGSWAKPGERLSNEKVGRRFDRWRKT